MKRKIFSLLLSLTFILVSVPTAFAAGPEHSYDLSYYSSFTTTSGKTQKYYNEKLSTMNDLLSLLHAGKVEKTVRGTTYTAIVDKTVPYVIQFSDTKETTDSVTNKVIIAKVAETVALSNAPDSGSDSYTILNASSTTINAKQCPNTGYAHSLTLSGGLEVQSGATLILDNNDGGAKDAGTIAYTFSNPVTVSGTLEFSGNTGGLGLDGGASGPVTFAEGSSLTVNNGGKVVIGNVELKNSDNSTDPLITVENGGELTVEGYAAGGFPEITTAGTAIMVKSGGELTVNAGKIETTSTTASAIVVESGGTVAINTTETDGYIEVLPTTVITSASNDQAIDLAAGSSVKVGGKVSKKGGTTTSESANVIVTVAESSAETADNYVDNYGNIILAKGAKTGEGEGQTLNAAVITPDGTIIQGSPTEAPTLETTTDENGKTTTTVTIPKNGSVTMPDKTTETLTNGGTATSTPKDEGGTTTKVTENKIDVESVALNKSTLSLKVGGSETLTATVESTDATEKTVAWTSDNTEVATVDTTGKVTALKAGTATITATAGDKNATCTVTVTSASSGGPSTPSYSVTAPAVDNGKVTVSPKYAKKNSTVTLTVTPDEGYELSSLAVTDAKGNVLELTDKGNGKYTFTMPASKVEITATFKQVPTTHVCPAEKYTDVDTTQWYHEGVDYVIANGMMNGTGTNIFEPNATTTRGMIVTILYRLEKEPAAGTSPFTDVDAGQWYAKAVAWAAANGVVNGTSPTTFNPNDPITREQMAAILYRYASFKGYDVTAKADLAGFTDAAQISDYAKDPMAWANKAGLIGGVSATTLQPQGSAIRAQVATILMRFCENVVK